jgi:hypothetical protein
MAAVAYLLLERALVSCNGPKSKLATAVGHDLKAIISLALYTTGILLAFFRPWIAIVLYVAVALAWFLPDRRIESLKKT